MELRIATQSDEEFVKKVFAENKNILGNYYFDWVGYINSKTATNCFYIADNIGILHVKFSKKQKGFVIQTIAILKDQKRKGYASDMIKLLPRPIYLKTDADNEESNSFYKAIGFIAVGNSISKNGKKEFTNYMLL